MKKLFLTLAAVAVAVTSCQKDVVYNEVQTENFKIEEQSSPYAVSEEEALIRLDAFMSVIDRGETRSKHRNIRNIQAIKYNNISAETRSNEDDVDNLLYIVEFEDGQGSAVLGADRRVDEVFAVLESGTISADDFESVAAGCDSDNLEPFLAKLIMNEAVAQVNESNQRVVILPPTPTFPSDSLELSIDVYEYIDVKNTYDYIEPMIQTKWDQGEPFNDKFPMTSDHSDTEYKPVAGCGAIATAQLLVYHSLSDSVTLNGNKYYYDDLSQFTYDNFGNAINNEYLANQLKCFIYDVAEEMNSEYYPIGTSTSRSDAARVMRKAEFTNVLSINNNIEKIKEMIDDGRPVFIRATGDMGTSTEDDDMGHAWLLDGRLCYNTTTYKVTKRNGLVVDREAVYYSPIRDYVHCNFGYYGKCDGYYNYNIYDICNERSDEMREPGDIAHQENNTYDVDIKMIKYNVN